MPSVQLQTKLADTETSAAPVEVGRPPFRIFTDRDGLPQNTIVALAFDLQHYLWVGTQDGAAYYNGRKWIVVNMPERTISNYVRTLLATADGSIWFGKYAGGLCRLKDGQWTSFNTDSGLPNNRIRCLLETTDTDGSAILWVGTDGGGLARWQHDSWSVINTSDGLPDNRVSRILAATDSDGKKVLWIGTFGGGLAQLKQGKITTFSAKEGLVGDSIRSLLVTQDAQGQPILWVGTDTDGLSCLHAGHWQNFNTSNGLPSNRVDTLLETKDLNGEATVWIGTAGGLVAINKGKWTYYNVNTGLPNNSIWSLLQTETKGTSALWVGTFGGLVRLENAGWLSYDTKTGLPDNGIFSLANTIEDGNQVIWIGTFGGGLARLINGHWQIFTTSNGLPDNTITSSLATTDPDGQPVFWAGTASGLAKFKGGRWTVMGKKDGLPSSSISRLCQINHNGHPTILVGTINGLAILAEDGWHTEINEGLPNNAKYIAGLYQTTKPDGSTTIWIGSREGGLGQYTNGKWRIYNRQNGLPNNWILGFQEVKALDGSPWLWVGTNGAGVLRLNLSTPQLTWDILSDASKPAIPSNVIYQIRKDRQDRIYLFTAKGVTRLTPRQPTPEDSSEFFISTFTIEDGLPSGSCTEAGSMVDNQGRIWAGTTGGAAMFDPNKEVADTMAKPLYIEQMLVDGTSHHIVPAESLAYDQNSLVFEYALLSFFRESDTRYKTQLVGLDPTPSEWTTDYKKEYPALPARDYVFKVWGKDYAGNIAGPIIIPFHIRPAPWRSWSAYLLYLIILSSIVYIGVRLRLQTLRQRNALLEQLFANEQQVTKTLKELDGMKTSFMVVTSHEMRTPLTILKGYHDMLSRMPITKLTEAQNQSLAKALKTCHRTVDRLINSINDILQMLKIDERQMALKPTKVDIVQILEEILAELQIFVEQRQQDLQLIVPGQRPKVMVDVEKTRLIFLNILQNAIKFTPDNGAIKIEFQQQPAQLLVAIKDTGIGIQANDLARIFDKFYTGLDPSQHTSGQYKFEARGVGLGLSVAKGYVEAQGGKIWAESAGAGQGSCFYILLPLATD